MSKLTTSLTLLLLITPLASQSAEKLHLQSIKAQLFYQHSGTLSKPLTGQEALWNTMIGEGDAEEPATATLVTVVVAGKAGSYDSDKKVSLTIKHNKSKKVLSNQTRELGVLSNKGLLYLPFWLNDTACDPLLLTARLTGSKDTKTLLLPFACGE